MSPDDGTTLYTTTYHYDARDNLVAVVDANNQTTRYVYDKGNRRIASIDALGGVVDQATTPTAARSRPGPMSTPSAPRGCPTK